MIPLNQTAILSHLQQLQHRPIWSFHVMDSLDSTQHFLKQSPTMSGTFAVCLAETQTAGRGRFDREWHSPWGENIYLSLRRPLNVNGMQPFSGLSLVAGLATLQAIDDFLPESSRPVQLKWPNDLIWQDKKIAGILIDLIHSQHCDIIIGVGINVNSQHDLSLQTHKPAGSLRDITGHELNRNLLVAQLIHQLHNHIEQWLATGFSPFIQRFLAVDYLKNKAIHAAQKNHPTIQGYAVGINEHGQLALVDANGNMHHFTSAETTLRTSMDLAKNECL